MQNIDIIVLEARSRDFFFHGQLRHLIALIMLLIILWVFATPYLGDDVWLGKTDAFWFWGSVSVAIFQQVIGWIVFRAQLGWGFLTKWFGKADLLVWGLLFIPLVIARLLLLLALGIADRGSITLPVSITLPLGFLLLLPAFYTMHSVLRYFGLIRAMGGDHFRRKYREMPLVRQGAYRWSDNAMYAYVFLVLWSMALFTRSQAALALVLFHHAYVWVHFHFTEKPDMELIYPDQPH
jgi:hypothetical protein